VVRDVVRQHHQARRQDHRPVQQPAHQGKRLSSGRLPVTLLWCWARLLTRLPEATPCWCGSITRVITHHSQGRYQTGCRRLVGSRLQCATNLAVAAWWAAIHSV
jgi:hypothetical protein